MRLLEVALSGDPNAIAQYKTTCRQVEPRVGRRTALRIVTSRPDDTDAVSYRDSIFERAGQAKLPERDLVEAWKRAEEEIEKGAAAGIRAFSIHDPNYPGRLSKIPDPPAVLFVKGDPEAVRRTKMIAVVGTREPTLYGETVARRSGKTAVEAGFAVVSGLAHGCDTLAHEGCLDASGVGVAVMAHGLDKVYPAANRDLAARLLECVRRADVCVPTKAYVMPPGTRTASERKRPYGNAYGHVMGTGSLGGRSVIELSGGNGAPVRIKLRTRMLLKLQSNSKRDVCS